MRDSFARRTELNAARLPLQKDSPHRRKRNCLADSKEINDAKS
jgi:hypothetical protein